MPPDKRQQPDHPSERRGRPALKHNEKLAEAFGITPGPDPPRETVQVRYLPDPPGVEAAGGPAPEREEPLGHDETVLNIIKDEMEELGTRLARFRVQLTPAMKQEIVDHVFTVISLAKEMPMGGGAIARR